MKSKITKVNNKQTTVRTIIPKPVAEMLQLNYGDYIEWKPIIDNGEIKFQITKDKTEMN